MDTSTANYVTTGLLEALTSGFNTTGTALITSILNVTTANETGLSEQTTNADTSTTTGHRFSSTVGLSTTEVETSTAAAAPSLCSTGTVVCETNICFKDPMTNTFNGVCCRSLATNTTSCRCFLKFDGMFCQHEKASEDVSILFNFSKGISLDFNENLLVLGFFLTIMMLILVAVIVFVVIRMKQKKDISIMEESDEPGSPLLPTIDDDKIDNVFVMRSRNSMLAKRISSQASTCCRHPSHRDSGAQFRVPSPLAGGNTGPFNPSNANRGFQTLVEEDEEDVTADQDSAPVVTVAPVVTPPGSTDSSLIV